METIISVEDLEYMKQLNTNIKNEISVYGLSNGSKKLSELYGIEQKEIITLWLGLYCIENTVDTNNKHNYNKTCDESKDNTQKINEGLKLQSFLTHNHLTHEDLANKLNLKRSSISNWIHGKIPMPYKYQIQIIELYNLPINYFRM